MSTLSLGVTFKNRRKAWGKHENRRTVPGVPTRKRRYVLAALALLAVMPYVPAGWRMVSHYIQRHPYFAIGAVAVDLEADALFSQQEIRAWSGVVPGMNLWSVDPEQVRTRLLTHQGIRDAEVRREFPQRLVLQVRTRRPVAIVAHPAPTYLDKDGVWFTAPAPRDALDLPYLTGFGPNELDAGETRSALAGTVPLLALAAKLWPEPVSEIRWDQGVGYTAFLTRRHVTVRLGLETAPEKFAQVAAVLARWPAQGPPALFDARFTNQIVVRPVLDEYGLRPGTPADPL